MWHNHVSKDQNLKKMSLTQCGIHAAKLRLRLFWVLASIITGVYGVPNEGVSEYFSIFEKGK